MASLDKSNEVAARMVTLFGVGARSGLSLVRRGLRYTTSRQRQVPPILQPSPNQFAGNIRRGTPADPSVKVREDASVRWRFPADDRTMGMISQVSHGVISMVASVTYSSSRPLSSHLFEEALNHLHNKMEMLRLCFRHRDGQLWVADMPRRLLDFKTVEGDDVIGERSALANSPFNLHDGPLWKARLMTSPVDAPCNFPEVEAAFPHQYTVIMSYHHAASDGVSMGAAFSLLHRIIDDLAQGGPVDTRPFGELRDSSEAVETENRIRTELESNPERLRTALKKHVANKHLPLLIEALGVPNEPNPTSNYLPLMMLGKQLMEKLIHKSRSLGVTLNSTLTAVFNIAQVEMAREAGLVRDTYTVSSRHPVDTRRLMKDNKSFVLGYHSIPMTQITATPCDARRGFWQYAKHVDSEFRNKLARSYMCEERVLDAILRPTDYSHQAHYSRLLPQQSDYLFTNMSSLHGTSQPMGKFVQITGTGHHMNVQEKPYRILHILRNIRDQFCLETSACTGTITKQNSIRYQEKIWALLHDIAEATD